ncbi:MAG: histidine kinase [Saprospiraceae bacterium]|nr:histidine kinase [Lewinella sp.]
MKISAKLLRHPWLQHGCFWLLSTYVLLRIFNKDPDYFTTDLIYTFLFQFALWFVVYAQLLVLIPRFFKSGRYVPYGLGFLLSLFIGVGIHWLTFTYLADWLFPGYFFISYYKLSELLQFMLVFAVTATLLHLSKSWFELRRKEKQIHQLEREKLDAELQALRAQLDPHFLFNSLNNVYSLALDKDEKVPAYLLRLSDNLRYMLYESREVQVPFAKELEYMENYLFLQQLKFGEKVHIDLQLNGEVKEQQVAPLLFIPFIENSFKHGMKGKTKNAAVLIRFELAPDSIRFHIRNTLPQQQIEETTLLPTSGGIGLENVKKRLALLYPGRHELKISKEAGYFEVKLWMSI